MGGDQLQELLQTNLYRSETTLNGVDSRLSSLCFGDVVRLLAPDQLVYLKPPRACPTSSCSCSSSHSSQVSMDDAWSPGLRNTAIGLQESIVLANSNRKLSDAEQEQLFHESTTEGFYPYIHGQFEPIVSDLVSRSPSNSLPRFARNNGQQNLGPQSEDQRHLSHSNVLHGDISGRSATDHQSCIPESIKQQTISKSSKATVAKRRSPSTKRSEHGIKKRPRTEINSSPSPSNRKAGKDKMGDRITTLQRLVSPFGKADTGSVLSECIEYIRFLHEQVFALSTSYMMSNRADMQHFQDFDDCFYEECASGSGPETGLRSRGLCIVPVSTTFSLTRDTPGGLLDTDIRGIGS